MNRERKDTRTRTGSVIMRGLNRATAWLYALIASSLLGRTLGGYGKANRAFENSRLYALLHGAHKRSDRLLVRLRLRLARVMEQSLIRRAADTLASALMRCSVNTYGVFSFFFGCYSIISYMLLLYSDTEVSRSFLVTGVLMVAAALPMFATGKPLARALGESRFFRTLLVGALGISNDKLDSTPQRGEEHYLIAMLAAIVGGLLTIVVPPYVIPLAILLLVALRMVLQQPEIGLLLAVFSAPLLTLLDGYRPTAVLLFTVALTTVSYLLKIVGGQRIFRMELSDYAVLSFMLMLAFGGIVTRGGVSSLRSAMSYCTLMLGYFLTVNLVRSTQWLHRILGALLSSGVLVAVLGITQKLLTDTGAEYFDPVLFADIDGRVFSTLENPNMLAEYLILLIPFTVGLMLLQKRLLHGFGFALCAALYGACLVYTWSRGAWLGALVSVVLLLLMMGSRSLSRLLLCAIPAAALLHYLPETVIRRFVSIGSMTDTSIRYRVYLWQGVGDMLADYWMCGVGVGEHAFSEIYTRYALPGIESAAHSHSLYLQLLCELGVVGLVLFVLSVGLILCRAATYLRGRSDKASRVIVASGICAIVALLLMGVTDHIWYNYRIFYLFWIVMGLTVAQMRIGEEALAYEEPVRRNTKTGSEAILYF